ncbi:MAG: collagenase-like protease, partial [Erysipelotrichaceae bacterium]|nr:collagenase-like protease [Erysipelotrichaceae bacterium]
MRTELLAPAGDLERLKIAVMYGADAVYFGGRQFSLRARASNFSVDDIREAALFSHGHVSRVYVTVKMIP